MKQSEIVAGRYYRSARSYQVRLVLDVVAEDGSTVRWCIPTYGDGERLHKETVQTTKSFARWAGVEVRPLFDPVVRCTNCGGWEWIEHAELWEECQTCKTRWLFTHAAAERVPNE